MPLIPQEKPKQIALLVGAAALVLLYVFHAYWYTPRVETIESLQTRLTTLQDQNRVAQVAAARGGANLEERLAIYERHMARLEELIPGEDELSGLLNSMSLEARRVGVEIASLNPGATQEETFYIRQAYDMTVWGEYHNIGRFLTSIASLPRIVTPMDLEIEPFARGEERGMVAPVTARFRIETYVMPRSIDELPALPEGGV